MQDKLYLVLFPCFTERYCQQNVPTVIVTKGHELYIHFKAQSGEKTNSSLDRRFKGIYLTHSRGTPFGNIFVIQFCSACSDETRVNTSTRIHDVVNFPTLETGNYMHRTRDRYQLVSITIHCAIEDSLPIP